MSGEAIRFYGSHEPDYRRDCLALRTTIAAQLGVLQLRQEDMGEERFMSQDDTGTARMQSRRSDGMVEQYAFNVADGSLTVVTYDTDGEIADIIEAADDSAGYAALSDMQVVLFNANDAAYRALHPNSQA
jgi:hypothetical protein